MDTDSLKNQLPPAFVFSQSSLQDYLDCPRRFQLRYIEKLSWPAVETEPVMENERRQQAGQLFHRLVQQHLLGLPVEKLNRLAATSDLRRWWENYLGTDFHLEDHPFETELTLSASSGEFRLVAKVDLVVIQPGPRAVIYDWKTYQKRPREEQMAARVQTRIYRSLLVRSGAYLNGGKSFEPEQVEMVYWYADFPTEPARFPYTAAQYQRDRDGLDGLMAEISNHRHFPLTEDQKKCAWCPYRSYCSREVEPAREEGMGEIEPSSPLTNLEQVQEIEF